MCHFQAPCLHQNICSKVILIDEDFDARITDFRLANPVKSSAEFGYIAPECPSNMVASIEGDVDGFGVALLELIPGRKPLEICTKEEGFEGSLVNLVNKLSACG